MLIFDNILFVKIKLMWNVFIYSNRCLKAIKDKYSVLIGNLINLMNNETIINKLVLNNSIKP